LLGDATRRSNPSPGPAGHPGLAGNGRRRRAAGGTTIEHHYRFVGFHFREPNRNSGGEITNFALRSQSCHSSSCERVILDRGHVSNDGEMSTSQNGVHVTAKWHDHYFVKGTISTGGSTVHYEANLFSP